MTVQTKENYRKLKVDTFIGPSFLASALVNGDTSGLSDPDDFLSLRWLESKVFYYDGKPDASGEYFVILCGEQGPEEQPGWYFMVEDEPYGPWATKEEAEKELAAL